jgi:hypothetical protein
VEVKMDTIRQRPGLLFGLVLVVLGLGWLAFRWTGVDLNLRADDAWPLFVIVPGLVLAGLAVLVEPPKGLGFAIAGSIITVTGIVLWVQLSIDRYDTWAYAWALVGPGAAGLGLLLYGLYARVIDQVKVGLTLGGIGVALFVVGAWYFEPVLTEGRQPVDLEAWWPVLLVAAGVIVALASFLGSGSRRGPQHA